MVKASLALGALLLSGAVLAAPESLMKVDTAKGEILLEVQANGIAIAKIVKVSTACDLGVVASSKAEAEKSLNEAQRALRDAFNTNGLGSAVLDFSAPPSSNSDVEYPVPYAVEMPNAPSAKAGSDEDAAIARANDWNKPRVRLQRRIGVSVGSATEMETARAVFVESNCNEDYNFVRRPNIELADTAMAQTEAKAKAITAAKAQAESYAAALGMRVVRIIRVSETGAIKEFLGSESGFILDEMRGERNRRQPVSDDVPVTASISMDFVLGPR